MADPRTDVTFVPARQKRLLPARKDFGYFFIDFDVMSIQSRGLSMQIEIDIDMRSEQQTVGGTAEVEHSCLIAFVDMLSVIDSDLAC